MPPDLDLDPDDPQEAIFAIAVIDDDGDRRAGGPGIPGAPGYSGVKRQGCGDRGCVGCLIPILVVAAALVAGLGVLPLAAILGLAALVLALIDRPPRGGAS